MPEPDATNPAPGGEPSGNPTPAPSPAPEGGSKGENWEQKYKELQKTVQLSVEANKALTDERNTWMGVAEDRSKQVESLKGQLDTVSKVKGELETKVSEFEKQVASAETKALRTRLIMTEFPELGTLEARGALPSPENPTEDSLREAFKPIQEYMNSLKTSASERAVSGAQPPAPPTTPAGETFTDDELITKAIAARRANKIDEYNRLMGLLRKVG